MPPGASGEAIPCLPEVLIPPKPSEDDEGGGQAAAGGPVGVLQATAWRDTEVPVRGRQAGGEAATGATEGRQLEPGANEGGAG